MAAVSLSDDEFDAAVEEALAGIPAPLRRLMDNVAVLVEREPPPEDEELLGVYEGTPLTERDETWAGQLPDCIVLYQGPLERLAENHEDLRREIAVTVVHEVAHYFGIDEDRLHALGWG